jgi:hypothetical protein
MADIPEGYGVIAGRSQENAQKALAAADAAGVDQSLILTVDEGYLAPLAVLDAYDANAETVQNLDEDEPEESPEEGDEGPAYPAGNASKAVWSKWAAETQGYDPAEDLSRAELIERYQGEKE